MLLEGKNAIVTGARRGIGAATLAAFAREGANVWACARKADGEFESRLAGIAREYGVTIEPVYFDLADEPAMKRAIENIRSSKRPIDALVNCAGAIPSPSSFAMTPISQFRDAFEVNFFAQMALTQRVVRIMGRQRRGAVVNVTSIAGIEGGPGQMEYGASKAALALATRKLASEYGAQGVRVNAVAPGVIGTDMGNQVPAEVLDRLLGVSALARVGEAGEVADAIAFLASDMSSYITGQVVRVDGGAFLALDRTSRPQPGARDGGMA